MVNSILILGSRDREIEGLLAASGMQTRTGDTASLSSLASGGFVPDIVILDTRAGGGIPSATPLAAPAPQLAQAREASQGIAAARRIDISAQPVAMAANDSAAPTGVSAQRTGTAYSVASGGAQVQPLTGGPSRTQGVGSRFRPAAARPTEKMK